MPDLSRIAAPPWSGTPLLVDLAGVAADDPAARPINLPPHIVSDLLVQVSRYGHQAVVAQYVREALEATAHGDPDDATRCLRLAVTAHRVATVAPPARAAR